MTTPSNVPTGYAGTADDFLKVKRDNSGAVRIQKRAISVADAATVGTIYGLVPFQKGFRLNRGGTSVHATDMDTATSVTLNVGYVYKTGSTETDDPDAFATLSTAPQAGGFVTLDEVGALTWVAADDGWIVAQTAGGAVTEAGTITAQIAGCYDGLDDDN